MGVTLSSNLTWTEHIEYVSTKINQRLGLLRRIKSLLPRSALIFFFHSLILPLFDYADIVWGAKDNAALMNNLQLLQNKAAKTISDRSFHSSAVNGFEALGWLTLEKRRLFHRRLYLYKCVNEISAHSMDLLANKDIHGYDTRLKDNLGLPRVRRNWGRQRTHNQAVKDWKSLDLWHTTRAKSRGLSDPILSDFFHIMCLSPRTMMFYFYLVKVLSR